MANERHEFDYDDELETVDEVREELSDVDAVRHVSLGPTLDEDADELRPSVWVHGTGEPSEVDDVEEDVELPVEQFQVQEAGDPYNPCTELCREAGTPRGGFEISPDLARRPAAGSIGLVGQRAGGNELLMVTAAHTFDTGFGHLQSVRQPASARQVDEIGNNPIFDGTPWDVIAFRLIPGKKNWKQRSEVAQVSGSVSELGSPTPGARAVNVGRTTGRTEGTISYLDPPWFGVQAEGGRRPLTQKGDSGGPWVTPPSITQNPKWLGIHLQSQITPQGWISFGLLAGTVEERTGFRLF